MSHVRQKYTWWVGVVVVVVGLALVPPPFAGGEDFPGDGVVGPPLRYKDKGKGTITDLNTRLIWEQKLAEDDPACRAEDQEHRSVHCVNNTYTWSRIQSDPNSTDCVGTNRRGTLFTDFLYKLNNYGCAKGETFSHRCTSKDDCDEVGEKCGFAGHRDWRIPNFRELQSIVDYGRYVGDTDGSTAAIHPDFGPTAPKNYWSSTSYAAEPTDAWIVNFDDGDADHGCKSKPIHGDDPLYSRAVRGGR